MKKRLLSVLLTGAMVVSLLNTSVFAAPVEVGEPAVENAAGDVSGEAFSNVVNLKVTNNYSMFKILEPAQLYTVNASDSDEPTNTLVLSLAKNSYDKLYLGAGDKVVDSDVVNLETKTEGDATSYTFSVNIPEESMEIPINVALHSAKNDRWYTRKITVSRVDSTLVTDNNAADYKAVENAIATIPTDLSQYSESGVAALNAAVDAVVYGKAADEDGVEEAIVAMARAITDAVSALRAEKFSVSCQATFWDESMPFATASFDQVSVKLVDNEGAVVFDQVGVYDEGGSPIGIQYFTSLDKTKTYTLTLSRDGYGLAKQGAWNTELHRYLYEFIGEDVYTQTITAENAGKNFIATFVKKPQALADAMALVPADLTMFTEDTTSEVQRAVASVNDKETAESEIQKMADAVVAAVKNLVPKDGVYKALQVSTDKLSSASRQLVVYHGKMYLKVVTKSTSMDNAYAGTKEAAPLDEANWIKPTVINNGTANVNVFVFPVEKLSTTFDTACRSASRQTWYGYRSIVEAHTLTLTDEDTYDPAEVRKELVIDNQTAMFKVAKAYLVTGGDGDSCLELSFASTAYPYLIPGNYDQAMAGGYAPDRWLKGTEAMVDKNGTEVAGYVFKVPMSGESGTIDLVAVSGSHLKKYEAGTEELYRSFFARQATLDTAAMTLTTADYENEEDYVVTANTISGVTAKAASMKTIGSPAANNYEMILSLVIAEDDVDKVYLGSALDAETAENTVAVNDHVAVISLCKNKTGGVTDYNYLNDKISLAFHRISEGWVDGSMVADVKDKTVSLKGISREFTDLACEKRYDTAAAIAVEAYTKTHGDAVPEGIIIVNSHSFADALAANAYAGVLGYPMLISKTDSVADAVTNLLKGRWHGVKNVVFVGLGFNDSASGDIKTGIKKTLTACGIETFKTVGGKSRYDTADAVYDEIMKINPAFDKVIVTTGNAAADALSAAAMSYSECYPILLVNKGKAHDTTLARIAGNSNLKEVILLGGEGVVNSNAACGKKMTRLFGDTRYETSRKIADYYADYCGAVLNNNVGFAHGGNDHFSDALVGGQLMGAMKAPILLISENGKHLGGIQTYVAEKMGGKTSLGNNFYFLGYVASNANGRINFDNMMQAFARGDESAVK